LLVRPNQAHDALPEIVFLVFFVFVIHGPSKKQNTENGTDQMSIGNKSRLHLLPASGVNRLALAKQNFSTTLSVLPS
jgi:hypothetical protein